MGDHYDYGRFALFQERHFRFAQVFLEAAFPGCRVTLSAVPRVVPDFRVDLVVGGVSTPGHGGVAAGVGFNVGIPLERRRLLELRPGFQALYLGVPLGYRDAFLFGASLGLEGRTSVGGLGATFTGFGSAGAYHQLGNPGVPGYSPPTPERTSGYAEAGGGVGVAGWTNGANLHARVEAAVGTELTRDPAALHWLRVGVAVGASF